MEITTRIDPSDIETIAKKVVELITLNQEEAQVWLTQTEAAKHCGVSTLTIYRREKKGDVIFKRANGTARYLKSSLR